MKGTEAAVFLLVADLVVVVDLDRGADELDDGASRFVLELELGDGPVLRRLVFFEHRVVEARSLRARPGQRRLADEAAMDPADGAVMDVANAPGMELAAHGSSAQI